MTEETSTDPVVREIARGVALGTSGQRAEAVAVLGDVWAALPGDGAALHRCGAAHALADVQDSLADELLWDQRALAAAEAVTDGDVQAQGMGIPASGLLPSLHLNLADVHRRLGDAAAANAHVAAARAALAFLPEDGYRAMIAGALDRVHASL